MTIKHNCPRCLQEIEKSRMRGTPIVCNSCGNVMSPSQKVSEESQERNFMFMIIGMAVVIVAGFIHVATWGSAWVQVIAFKAGEMTNGNSVAAIESMAQACLDLKRYECTERLYAKMALMDSRKNARLGKFQMSQRKYKSATESFRRFFAGGGGDIEVNYLYAKALGETGAIDEAARHFDYVLSAKPNVVQITVVQNYVRLLIGANKLDHAKTVIQKVRRRDQAVSSFMEAELKDIVNRQGGRA